MGVLAAIVILVDAVRKQRFGQADAGHLRKAQALALLLASNVFGVLPKSELTFALQAGILVAAVLLFAYGMYLSRRTERNAGK